MHDRGLVIVYSYITTKQKNKLLPNQPKTPQIGSYSKYKELTQNDLF